MRIHKIIYGLAISTMLFGVSRATILNPPTSPALLDSGGTASSILAYVPTTTLKVALARLLDARFYQPEWWGAVGNGVANDTAAISAAQAAANGRAIVWLRPNGTYSTTTLTLATNDHFMIDGRLIHAAGNATDLIVGSGVSNVVIEGSGIIDGNRANTTLPTNQSAACIDLNATNNVFIRGSGGMLHFTGCTNWPINAWNSSFASTGVKSTQTHFADLDITASGNSTECSNTIGCYVDHIVMHDTSDYCWSFYGGVQDGRIVNSVAKNCGSGGFGALDDGGVVYADNDILFANNHAYGNNGSGFSVYNTNGAYPAHTNVKFMGNESDHNNLGNGSNYGGFLIAGCIGCQVIGNTSHHNGAGGNATGGFFTDGHNVNVLIQGNISYDEGQNPNGGGLGYGFGVSGADVQIYLIGNNAYDDQSTKTMAFGFNGTLQPNGRSVALDNVSGPTAGANFNWTVASDQPDCHYDYGGNYTCNKLATSILADTNSPQVVLTGASYPVPVKVGLIRFTQTATIASQTVVLPTAIADTQIIEFDNGPGAVTAMTFSPAIANWTNGSQFAPYVAFRARWNASTSTWSRIQ